MVFSSLPPYLDPANWQQQPSQHHFHLQAGASQQLFTTPQTPPPPLSSSAQPQPVGGVGSPGSIRPGSMSERARLANIPMPEGLLKCPRCDSTNTKFCYFNNYSLTQPRHFCKTCKRYWTRGGALRSVPVGGGCRRNKRTTKSSTSTNNNNNNNSSNNKSPTSSSSTSTLSSHNIGLLQPTPTHHHANHNIMSGFNSSIPPMRFMSPLGQLSDNYNNSSVDIVSNFSGVSTPQVHSDMMNFQTGVGIIEQWRLQQQVNQQFPFLTGFNNNPPQSEAGIYPIQSGGSGSGGGNNKLLASSFLSHELDSVKMDDRNNNSQATGAWSSGSLSRQFLGMNNNIADQQDHLWKNTNNNNNSIHNNNTWLDHSSFSSSSTSNHI